MTSSALEVREARASAVTVTDEALTVDLEDGRTISVPLVWYPRLWHGTPAERESFEIFGNGAYIHWPELDEDLTVAGLLAGQQSGESCIIAEVAREPLERTAVEAFHGLFTPLFGRLAYWQHAATFSSKSPANPPPSACE